VTADLDMGPRPCPQKRLRVYRRACCFEVVRPRGASTYVRTYVCTYVRSSESADPDAHSIALTDTARACTYKADFLTTYVSWVRTYGRKVTTDNCLLCAHFAYDPPRRGPPQPSPQATNKTQISKLSRRRRYSHPSSCEAVGTVNLFCLRGCGRNLRTSDTSTRHQHGPPRRHQPHRQPDTSRNFTARPTKDSRISR
jgi:hypothetical protein